MQVSCLFFIIIIILILLLTFPFSNTLSLPYFQHPFLAQYVVWVFKKVSHCLSFDIPFLFAKHLK